MSVSKIGPATLSLRRLPTRQSATQRIGANVTQKRPPESRGDYSTTVHVLDDMKYHLLNNFPSRKPTMPSSIEIRPGRSV
jgi:hypothetical protein